MYVTTRKLDILSAETEFKEYMAETYGGSSVPVAWVSERVEVMYTLRSETPITLVP